MSNRQPISPKSGIVLGNRSASVEDEDKVTTKVVKENFPNHRTLHLIPDDDIAQTGDRVEIVVTEEVLFETTEHVGEDTSKESGGFLLGNRYECPNTNRKYIIVDQYMKADYTEGTKVSLTFKTESWAHLKDKLDGKYRGKELIGWYHSHPGMGIFLSNYDLDIHNNRFDEDWQVALVLDPIKHEGGFFGWVDGTINPHEKLDFYELLEKDTRETIVGWVNYTAEDPKTNLPAMVSPTNTRNPTGDPAVNAIDKPKPKTKHSRSLLRNPYVVIGAAAFALLLLLGAIATGYFWFVKKSDTSQNESTTEAETLVENKILKSKSVRIGKDLEGYISSKDVMYLNLEINGIGDIEVIEQIKEKDGVKIVINSQPAKVTNYAIDNGSILKLQTETDISSETVEAFQDDKLQKLKMSVEITYDGDLVTRELETNFKKGNSKKSLGYEIIFGGERIQSDTTTKTKKQSSAKTVSAEPQKKRAETTTSSSSSKETSTKKSGSGKTSKTSTSKSSKSSDKGRVTGVDRLDEVIKESKPVIKEAGEKIKSKTTKKSAGKSKETPKTKNTKKTPRPKGVGDGK